MGENGDVKSVTAVCKVCKAPTPLKCTRCSLVFYCSQQHQKDDWQNHKKRECSAFKIRTTNKWGRYLVASRDIKEGDMILSEDPIVVGPCFFQPVPCCVGCCRKLPVFAVRLCPGCQLRICCEECPGLASPDRHPAECQLLKAFQLAKNQTYPAEGLLYFRCARLQKDQPHRWETFKEVADYAASKAVDKSRLKERMSLENVVSADDPNSPSAEEIQAVLNVYSLDWAVPQGRMAGLYRSASFLQRSCAFNTRLSFEEALDDSDSTPSKSVNEARPVGSVKVCATRDILKGEILTWSSANQLNSTVRRQKQLIEQRNIRCSCARCLDPQELGTNFGTLKCALCSGWVLPVDTIQIERSDWLCRGRCATILTAQMASDILFNASRDIQSAEVFFGSRPWELLLAKLQSSLHPNHELCFSLKLKLMNSYVGDTFHIPSYIPDAYIKKKTELGRELLKIIEELVPFPVAPEDGEILTLFFQQHLLMEREFLSRNLAGPLNPDQTEKVVKHCQSLLHRWFCSGVAATRSLEGVSTLSPLFIVQSMALVEIAIERMDLSI